MLHLIFAGTFALSVERVIETVGVVVLIVKVDGGTAAQVVGKSTKSVVGITVQLAPHHLIANNLQIHNGCTTRETLAFVSYMRKDKGYDAILLNAHSPPLCLDNRATLENHPFENNFKGYFKHKRALVKLSTTI